MLTATVSVAPGPTTVAASADCSSRKKATLTSTGRVEVLWTATDAVTVAPSASPGAAHVITLESRGSSASSTGPVTVNVTSSHRPVLRSRTGCQKSQPALTWFTTLRPISLGPLADLTTRARRFKGLLPAAG